MIELKVFKGFMICQNRIQGVKGSRRLVKLFENKFWASWALGPLNPYGMTFIEVIAALAIVVILAAVAIPKLGSPTISSGASVNGAAYMIASDIRYAQEFAMTRGISKSVIFTSGSSVYTFNPTNNLDPSGRLPSGVTIGSNFTITFNSLGEPTTGGGGSVSVSGGGQTKAISVVNYTGKVNIT